jgi:hypothetical protein
MSKSLLWVTVCAIVLGMCAVVVLSIGAPGVKLLDIGTFAIITLTFTALIFYASDTNRLARITQAKWERETILYATYEMVGQNDRTGPGRILFRLNNPSRLIIRAKVWADFKVYGVAVDPGDSYNGTNTWILFPQQISQGWYQIEDLIVQQGKSIAQMQAEYSAQNRLTQLTLDLTIEFRDELKNIRKLPTRRHYFSFQDWTWVPDLTRKDDDLWANGLKMRSNKSLKPTPKTPGGTVAAVPKNCRCWAVVGGAA